MKKFSLILVIFLSLGMLLAACGGGSEGGSEGESGGESGGSDWVEKRYVSNWW
ncbi:hypothetical protein [Piscibacillus salipiscarius]|uniref:hypothetical protein n=1 Tax=Piscibacillus salipiscarius TaxID=299480 RepID=UPI002436849B|nr:hypothetical protein [Piscibacillus salipiscarius]